MTIEMTEKIHELGGMIKADASFAKMNEALDAYERDEELMSLINRYNDEQDKIVSLTSDKEARDKSAALIDELYSKIVSHPVYLAYVEAKREFDELLSQVWAELQFAITGQNPCTHDCSTCGGCH